MFVQVEEVTFERDPPPAGRPQQQQQQQLGHIKSTNITFKTQEYADLAYSKLKTAKLGDRPVLAHYKRSATQKFTLRQPTRYFVDVVEK
eukprot:19340-Heterococcus_DN1.PRE.1